MKRLICACLCLLFAFSIFPSSYADSSDDQLTVCNIIADFEGLSKENAEKLIGKEGSNADSLDPNFYTYSYVEYDGFRIETMTVDYGENDIVNEIRLKFYNPTDELYDSILDSLVTELGQPDVVNDGVLSKFDFGKYWFFDGSDKETQLSLVLIVNQYSWPTVIQLNYTYDKD